MPGQMPEMLSRGVNLEKLDTLLAGAANQKAALQMLKALPTGDDPNDAQAQTALRQQFVALVSSGPFRIFDTDARDHFDTDWLNGDGNGWWPEADPIAPILRQGFIRALELALQKELDVETLWVCNPPTDQGAGDGATGRVHVGITWSTKILTVVIYTPRLPPEGVVSGPTEPVLVVRWDGMPKSQIVEKSPG